MPKYNKYENEKRAKIAIQYGYEYPEVLYRLFEDSSMHPIDIGVIFNLSEEGVWYHLRKRGHKRRGAIRLKDKTIIAIFKEKGLPKEIADKHGVSRSCVALIKKQDRRYKQVFEKNGITIGKVKTKDDRKCLRCRVWFTPEDKIYFLCPVCRAVNKNTEEADLYRLAL